MNNVFRLLIMFILFMGCSEYEMIKYTETPRVNFIATSGENYSNFNKLYDYTSKYNQEDVDSVFFRLQGHLNENDTKVKFKIVHVSGKSGAKVELINDEVIIQSNNYKSSLKYRIVRPLTGGDPCLYEVHFDYPQSDVMAGTIERQVFTITIADDFVYTWESLKISEDEWNNFIKPYIGEPGPMKIRFMLSLTYYYPNGLPDYVAKFQGSYASWCVNYLNTQLRTYNKKNEDNPLTEADGTLVTFQP